MRIDLEHPEYVSQRTTRQRYRDLYVGGEQLKNNAHLYLMRRQKEPSDVYQERLERVFYENYIGSIIDWYAATLFRREPILSFEGSNEPGKQFFREFTEDCDRKGTTLCDFMRHQFIQALVYGRSYILIDFPRLGGRAGSRAEEDAYGWSRAYLVDYTPEQLTNWGLDDQGSFEWVVLRDDTLHQDVDRPTQWIKTTRWLYYDKCSFRVYRRTGAQGHIELVDEGRHGLAGLGRVPLLTLQVAEGLWLMNKAGLLQLEHFNKSNALSWALTMGLFAMPVVYTEREWNQIVGESYYIQLSPQDRFGWTEPEGKVFQIAADNLSRLQEEIYRVCYVMSQGGGSLSSATAQSAMSKQRDFAITQEVLRAYGDAVKATLKRMLRSIDAARQDGLVIDVSGLDQFDIGDFGIELANAKQLLSFDVSSPTLKKQIYQRLVSHYLCDARQELKDRIAQEIDEAIG